MNANTIISSALRKLMVTPSGGTPSANQLSDGLEALNDIVSIWSANSSLIYQDTREEITVPVGTSSMTIGSTGDYVTGKPIQILNAAIKVSNSEYPLNIIDKNVYETFYDKTKTGRPDWIYFRDTDPNSTIYFDRTTDSGYTLVLTSMKSLSLFVDGTTDVQLPEYYETALKYNLVIALASEFGAANRLTQMMIELANDSKNAVIGRAVKANVSKTEVTYINGYVNGRGYYNPGSGT